MCEEVTYQLQNAEAIASGLHDINLLPYIKVSEFFFFLEYLESNISTSLKQQRTVKGENSDWK